MNTTPEKPLEPESGKPGTEFSNLKGDDEDSPNAEALAELSGELLEVKDARIEERFLWIMVCVILIDVIWFSNSPNPAFPVVVLILEIIALFILARRMGVEEVTRLFERVLTGIGQRGGGG